MAKRNHTPIQLPLAIDDLTVEIPLTRGYTTIVDAIDADLAQFYWQAHSDDTGMVYVTRTEYLPGRVKVHHRIHRDIVARVLGRPLLTSEQCDHEDRNPMNNRRSNLRLATPTENMRNRGLRKDNKSGVRGVWWSHKEQRWIAYIRIDKKLVRLGRFKDFDTAVDVRREAERRHFGDFAPLEED